MPVAKNTLRLVTDTWDAFYCRLSRDDDLEGDSNSIAHQEVLYIRWFHHLIYMTAVHLWQNGTLQLLEGWLKRQK